MTSACDVTMSRHTSRYTAAPNIGADTPAKFFPWAAEIVGPVSSNGPDWDGYGAMAPTQEAMEGAAVHLASIRAALGFQKVPDVQPMPNGGVSLEWEFDQLYLLIEISKSGDAQFLYRGNGNQRKGRYRVYDPLPFGLSTSLKLIM